MAYVTYKTTDGAPTGDTRKFRDTESKENFKVSGSDAVEAVVTAVAAEFGSVTLENIHIKLRNEAALSDTDKTIPALTGSGVFTTGSEQLKNKFAAHTKGDQTFGTPTKTTIAVAQTTTAASSPTLQAAGGKK
tara:strand:+ start:572 stop:970 length:399 start_codon:yes stop_codon:yes gene_type:complete